MAVIFAMFILFQAGNGGGSSQFYNDYLNIPGFEMWKFVNLAIFIGILIYVGKYFKLPEKFKARRDAIRAELLKAEEEKKAALAKLMTIEARLARLESERESILGKAKEEAEAERKRLTEQTRAEIARLREQAEADVNRLARLKNAELRRFSAEESIRLAGEKLRSEIGPDVDARLVKASISEIGGLN